MSLAPDILIFALSSLGFGALSASMERHARQVFGTVPQTRIRRLGWSVFGWSALMLALIPAILAYGLSIGVSAWVGFLAVAATVIAFLLAYWPKSLRPAFYVAIVTVLATVLLAPDLACAQPDLRVAADTSLLQDETSGYRFETFKLPARPDDSPRYRVYLATPLKPPPPEGYPVVYLLDGNAVLDTLRTQTATLKDIADSPVPPVLVLIGYETLSRFDVVARAYDYTPPIPGEPELTDTPGSGRKAGGAEAFRDFLADRLKPGLLETVRLDLRRQTLWGHSYGGLFVLYMLFTHPEEFQHYAAISPSLWWHDGWIVREEKSAETHALSQPVTLLAMSGDDEAGVWARRSPAPRNALSRDSLQKLIKRLNARDNLSASLVQSPGKMHGEMFAIGLETALRGAVETRRNLP